MSILDDITLSPSNTRVRGFSAKMLNLNPVILANDSLIFRMESSRLPAPMSIFRESASSRAYFARSWSRLSPISAA